MSFSRKFKYLSSRAAALSAALGAAALLPRPASYACLAAAAAAGWFWIARKYLRSEKSLKQYLEGYPILGEDPPGYAAVSPSAEMALDKLRDVLSPSQLFDINKRQAQYLALQNQINPHFLYNTLESIRSEAMTAGLGSVADMTELLATFFRYTITKAESLVSVEEELLNCETYFNIQQYRFGNRLRMNVECAAEDRAEIFRCRLPKLTMQPILENSIIHGTELKIGAGNLTINLERTERRLLIRISDDGLGMDEETLAGINARFYDGALSIAGGGGDGTGGLALANVNNRIRLLFGDEYGLHVYSIPGAGTDVEISLPSISSDREIQNRELLKI